MHVIKPIFAALLLSAGASAQATSVKSIPVSNIRYDVTFDSATAISRTISVSMRFSVAQPGPVLLSLPDWTPGAYEIANFARFIVDLSAAEGTDSLRWDKADPDTWRVNALRPGDITVNFDYRADSLDNANAWSKPDFAF